MVVRLARNYSGVEGGEEIISTVPECLAPGLRVRAVVRTRPWRWARLASVTGPEQEIWPRTLPSMNAEEAVTG